MEEYKLCICSPKDSKHLSVYVCMSAFLHTIRETAVSSKPKEKNLTHDLEILKLGVGRKYVCM